jgi:type I restriction enzyme R subunit
MQAIARANRVDQGKENGLIVDYCGILKNLRKALATFGGHSGDEDSTEEVNPVAPEKELLAELDEAIDFIRTVLQGRQVNLDDLIHKLAGFERVAALVSAKEAINADDEGRKRFEIASRAVFAKYKACLTIPDVASRRPFYAAINFIYKSLQDDREKADISDIIKELHGVVAGAIRPMPGFNDDGKVYDISAIDFERLRQEFERSPGKNSQIRALRDVIEQRLAAMIARNPLRMNFQQRYEELVIEYNAEKDRVTIENSFEQLWRLVRALDEESERALREGLDGEDTLALFDLLKKPELTPNEIKRIKGVATELCAKLKAVEKEINEWRRKERTRDRVRQMIHDTLFSDGTGLPSSYSNEEIDHKTETIFGFI